MSGSTLWPTRILSWQQLVLEADPNWQRDALQPWIYEFSNGRLFYATIPMYGAAPASGLFTDGNVLMFVEPSNFPTTPAGLLPGEVWDNGGTVSVVGGAIPQPGAPAALFPGVTTTQLLEGLPNLKPVAGVAGSGVLWSNGNEVCVS